MFNDITDEQQEVEVVSAGGRQWLHSLHECEAGMRIPARCHKTPCLHFSP